MSVTVKHGGLREDRVSFEQLEEGDSFEDEDGDPCIKVTDDTAICFGEEEVFLSYYALGHPVVLCDFTVTVTR